MKAVIGGTGVYELAAEGYELRTETIDTPYGKTQIELASGRGAQIAFLARHGKGHAAPPHRINYRANIKALHMLGVDEILAACAVGAIKPELAVGDVVILRDFLDFTKSRVCTFFDGEDGRVGHAEMSSPYCPELTEAFLREAPGHGVQVKGSAVYVCTEGPRFETAAEIQMFARLGGDVAGMTNIPESVLAKELGMCYAAVGMVSNMCTGVSGAIGGHDIASALAKNKKGVTETFMAVLTNARREKQCTCAQGVIFL